MATSTDSSWVDLLSRNGSLVVRDNTPARETIRCQVSSLLKDKRRLTQDALKSRERVAVLESELSTLRLALAESHNQNTEVCKVLEEQSVVIAELRSGETTLEQGIRERDQLLEGLFSQVQQLREQVNTLSQTVGSSQEKEQLLAEQQLHSEQQAQSLHRLTEQLNGAREALERKEAEMTDLKSSQLATINEKCQQVEHLKLAIERQLVKSGGCERRSLQHQVAGLEAQVQTLTLQLQAREHLVKELQEQTMFNGSVVGSEASLCSSTSSLRRQSSKLYRAQSEACRLRQRLSESRARVLSLEAECAQLKTEAARLSGSQQALLAIRATASLSRNNWEGEKTAMSSHINQLHSQLSNTKQLVSQGNLKYVALETELSSSRHDVSGLQGQLSQMTLELDHVMSLCHVTNEFVQCRANEIASRLPELREEVTRTEGEVGLLGSISQSQSLQIQVVDNRVAVLCGEVEVLRARRKVALSSLKQPPLANSCEKLKEQLRREKKQTNFVRVRLGYVLGELRLYKQLKAALEARIGDMEVAMTTLQTQHLACVNKLRTAQLE